MNLSPWIILPGVGKIFIAVAFILFARHRGGSWRYLGLGALFWIVTVAIKLQVAAQVNPVVYQALYIPGALFALGSVLFYVWANVLAFGIGFGTFESLYQGIPSLAASISALAAPQYTPEATLSSLQLLNDPLYGLAPATDRFAATLVHLFCSVLLFYGVASRQARWLWVSFALKCLVDTIAAFAILYGTPSLPVLWQLEVVLLVIGCGSWWGIRKVQRRYSMAQAIDSSNPGRRQLDVQSI
jgi:uncharacterized membrane protein YhfC